MGTRTYRNSDLAWLPSFAAMVGDKPTATFASNGSTYSPDVVCGVDIRPAAHYHDFHYSKMHRAMHGPHDEIHRYRADQLFLANLLTCGLSPFWARFYYYRVRLWGHQHYTYSFGLRPKKSLCFWLRLLFGRYVQW